MSRVTCYFVERSAKFSFSFVRNEECKTPSVKEVSIQKGRQGEGGQAEEEEDDTKAEKMTPPRKKTKVTAEDVSGSGDILDTTTVAVKAPISFPIDLSASPRTVLSFTVPASPRLCLDTQ